MWSDGKIDGKTARKPGNFGISHPLEAPLPKDAAGFVETCNLFFRFRRRTMRKTASSNNTYDDRYMDVLI